MYPALTVRSSSSSAPAGGASSPYFSIPFFFFNDTATTEIYTLSLHDALPISETSAIVDFWSGSRALALNRASTSRIMDRSEEHTSELQSRQYLVCRLLLEKKKKTRKRL